MPDAAKPPRCSHCGNFTYREDGAWHCIACGRDTGGRPPLRFLDADTPSAQPDRRRSKPRSWRDLWEFDGW